MEHENLQISIIDLANGWDTLRYNAIKKNSVNLEEFTKVFTDTYAILKELTQEPAIAKNYMPLILSAACYAKLTIADNDKLVHATFVLTERMLHYCISGNPIATMLTDCALIYSPGERKEVLISFNQVDASISEIIRILEQA